MLDSAAGRGARSLSTRRVGIAAVAAKRNGARGRGREKTTAVAEHLRAGRLVELDRSQVRTALLRVPVPDSSRVQRP